MHISWHNLVYCHKMWQLVKTASVKESEEIDTDFTEP